MGQAKRRGTFEERLQQSIDRNEAERLERQRKTQEWWDSLTPEQKDAEREKRRKRERSAATMGLCMLPLVAAGSAFGPWTHNLSRRR
jgi:hypothetical protein